MPAMPRGSQYCFIPMLVVFAIVTSIINFVSWPFVTFKNYWTGHVSDQELFRRSLQGQDPLL